MIFRRSATSGDSSSSAARPDATDGTEATNQIVAGPEAAGTASGSETTVTEQVEPAASAGDRAPGQETHPAEEQTAVQGSAPVASTPEQPDQNEESLSALASQKKPRRRGRKVALGVGLGVLLIGGAYAGAAWYLGDRVPQGTTVAGVDVSGMAAEQAREALSTQLAGVFDPIELQAGERSASIEPATAGLQIDIPGTVEELTDFTLDPRVVLGHFFGGGEREPVTAIDDDALTSAVEGVLPELEAEPVNGVLQFVDGAAEVTTAPANGQDVDIESVVEVVQDNWISAQRPLEIPAETTTPEIDDAAIEAATADLVEPLMSGPVIVSINDAEAEVSPQILANAASLEPDGASFALSLDPDVIAAAVTEQVPSIGDEAQDAQIVLRDGAPTIVPAVTGTGLDPQTLTDAVREVATSTEDRTATVELTQTVPEFSTEDAEALGVTDVISTFATPMPDDPPRTENLQIGASRINNVLVLPGETFSLLEEIGPITTANGYNASGAVSNGLYVQAAGGGLSQLSTTTFNAAFQAGMTDVTHRAHTRYFDRYPAGHEATIDDPSLDMQWRNNTDYGVLVQAWVGGGQTHVQLWSTPYWDVDLSTSERYNYTNSDTIYSEDPDCRPESGGIQGFTIDFTRTISHDGVVNDADSRSYSWTYTAWPRVVCGPEPEPPEE